MKISRDELIHHKMQAILRENLFPEDELKYLGKRAGHHWYLIDGQHEVPAEDIIDIEPNEE